MSTRQIVIIFDVAETDMADGDLWDLGESIVTYMDVDLDPEHVLTLNEILIKKVAE